MVKKNIKHITKTVYPRTFKT